MANQGGEVRAASLVGPQMSTTASASGLKLPLLLTARPGNVGVQIDAHRTMNLFSHPRSVKFTTQFHGLTYENGSLENYSRMVERTALRARLVQDKLEKLQVREQHLLEDEEKRKQRRVQREAARQRRMWQMHQAAKRADDRARENAAAVTVQKVVRGALARRITLMLRQARAAHEAASMLQRVMKTHVSRQQLVRERERRSREEEERREFEMHSAAEVLQRQARKRLKVVQTARQQVALAACMEDEDETEETVSKPSEHSSLEGDLLSDEKIIADALSRGISLDLLFSDEEDGESATNSTSSSSIASVEDKPPVANPIRILPQPPPPNASRPRRPMSIKRVGGGYRTKLLPYNAIDSCLTKEPTPNPLPATTRPSHGRTWQQEPRTSSSDINNDDFLRHPRRSPSIPTAASSPTLLAAPSKHPSRPPTTSQKSDSDEIRAVSPTTTSPPKVSPYAIPLRLLPSR